MKSIFNSGREIIFRGHTYVVKSRLGGGFSGQVYQVRDELTDYALKAFLPLRQIELYQEVLSKKAIQELLHLQATEYEFLSNLSHPNIVKVYGKDEVALTIEEKEILRSEGVENLESIPFLLLELVNGLTLNDALERWNIPGREFTHILLRIGSALKYLHVSEQCLHVDIKPSNIMVRASDREPVIIDFSLCKNLNFSKIDSEGHTHFLTDWDLLPLAELPADHPIRTLRIKGGKRELLKKEVFPHLDYFQMGKLLEDIKHKLAAIYDDREFAYIGILIERLTKWATVRQLTPDDFQSLLRRLEPSMFDAFGVPELSEPGTSEKTLQLPFGIAVPITDRLQNIIETPSWRRLATMNQLSLLWMV